MSQPPPTLRLATCPQCGASVDLPSYADLAVCRSCGSSLELLERSGREPSGGGRSAGGRPEAEPSPEQQLLHSLSCPQCAGSLSVWSGRRILLCSRCGVRVLVRSTDGLPRWLFPSAIDKLRALDCARRWLSDYPGIAKQARLASLTGARLVYAPIWEHSALVAGWEFGTKLRTQCQPVTDEEGNERLDLAVVEERFHEPHLQERRFYEAACDLVAIEATRPRFSGRELLVPLVAGEIDPAATVVETQGSAAEVSARGRDLALQPASGAADPHTRMLILKETLSLLYYPLWLVDYEAAGRPYRVVVDARTGTVNSAGAPASDARFTSSLILRVAVLVVAAAFLLWSGAAWEGGRVPMVFAAVIVCVAAVLLALRAPQGGKVEYHEPFSS